MAHNPATYGSVGGSGRVVPSFSLLDCLGRVRRVKAKLHAVASRALTRQHGPRDGSYRGGRGKTRARLSAQAAPWFAVPLACH